MSAGTTNLKNKTVTGMFWSLGEQFGRHGINILITLALARLLSPKDYGLIGLTTIFFAIATAIVEGGFKNALIRKKDLNQTDRSTVFYTNLVVSVILYVVLFFSSPLIALLFHEPRLTSLLRFIGIQIIVYAFQVVQVADLSRKMNFKTQVKITLPSGIVAGTVAVIMAWKGLGVWSLATQMVLSGFLTSVFYWVHNRWWPSLVFSWNSLEELFSFSSKLLLSSLLSTTFNNLYTFIIGMFFSTQLLGYYSFAMRINKMSAEQITAALQRVSYPALASLQNEKDKLLAGYRRIIQCSAHVIFPMMVFIALGSQSLLKLLFGDKWLPAVPFIQVLCVIGAMYPLNAINLNILYVKGRSDLFLKLEIIKKILVIGMLLITIPMGIRYLLIGQAILSIIAYFLNSSYSARLIDYSVIKQLRDQIPTFISSAAMAASLVLTNMLVYESITLQVLSLVVVGIVSYISASEILKINAYYTIRELLLKKLLGLRKKTPNHYQNTKVVTPNNGNTQ